MKQLVIFAISLILITLQCYAQVNKAAVIHGVELSEQKIKIQVTSTGCTTKESFELQFNEGALMVLRIKRDKCRRAPHKIWLDFDMPTATTKFTLANKLSL